MHFFGGYGVDAEFALTCPTSSIHVPMPMATVKNCLRLHQFILVVSPTLCHDTCFEEVHAQVRSLVKDCCDRASARLHQLILSCSREHAVCTYQLYVVGRRWVGVVGHGCSFFSSSRHAHALVSPSLIAPLCTFSVACTDLVFFSGTRLPCSSPCLLLILSSVRFRCCHVGVGAS